MTRRSTTFVPGKTSFQDGNSIPYEINIDRVADHKLKISLSFEGREGAWAELDFIPEDDGKATLLVTKIHSDHSVLRTALAGTDKAKLADAPDWMLNVAARPVLQQLAVEVEKGAPADFGWRHSDNEAKSRSDLTLEQREAMSEAEQEAATRPAVDPRAEAAHHMDSDRSSQ